MVRQRRVLALSWSALAVAISCQAVIGIEDKQLDPKLGSGGVAGTGGTEAGGAAPKGSDPVPPKRPAGPAVPAGGATRWFAVKTMYLGTFDPETKKADDTAWQRIGHNIDGECTTAEISKSNSSSTCAQAQGASPDSLEDGEGCRDNAAGRLVAVGTQVVSLNFEPELHAQLLSGETPTYLLRLDDLSAEPDDPYVRGALYISVPRDPLLTKPPSWDGTDQFAVDIASVDTSGAGGTDAGATDAGDAGKPDAGDAGKPDAGDAGKPDAGAGDSAVEAAAPPPFVDKPLYVFDKGYLSSNVWVSGDLGKSPMKVPLFVFKRITVINTATATMTLELTPEHDQAKSSQLSVAVATAEIDTQIRPMALELVNCIPALADLFIDSYILPARDLGAAPTLHTPGKPCDAQSFAFAFEWKPVKPPVSAVPGPLKPATCP